MNICGLIRLVKGGNGADGTKRVWAERYVPELGYSGGASGVTGVDASGVRAMAAKSEEVGVGNGRSTS